MILADTSVWVDHFRKADAELTRQLMQNTIAIHPFVVAELALGNLPNRQKTLTYFEQLATVKIARIEEVRHMIEEHSLFRRGIGLIDACLIASTFITPHTLLWTRDKRLHEAAKALRIQARID